MIDLNYSTEQNQIVAAIRTLLAKSFPPDRLRDEGRGPDRLDEIGEFGGFQMSLPEQADGTGLTVVEDVLLHIELGRNLVSPGALATALAGRLAHEAGLSDIVRGVLDGSQRVCLGNALLPSREEAGQPPGSFEAHLYDAEDADLVLVWDSSGAMLLSRASLTLIPVVAADRAIRMSRAIVNRDAIIVRRDETRTGVPQMAKLLISAQLLGMCIASRDMSVDYAKIRSQFGQPIGAFQAIKHRCANMTVNVDVLSAQLMFAATAQRDEWPDSAFQTEACWLLACRYALENARAGIQIHGGIGFSAESDMHRYLLRAHLFENIGGTTADRERAMWQQPAQSLGGTIEIGE